MEPLTFKINSEKLFEYINNLGTNEKVKFKVYYDDNYLTEIIWDGENFSWEPGTFTSGAFFNPLYDFEEIEEKHKKIEKVDFKNEKGETLIGANMWSFYYKIEELRNAVNYLLEKVGK